MSVVNNDNFPRGGKRILTTNESYKRKREDALFIESRPKPKKIRKAKTNKEKTSTEDLWQTSLKFNGTLTYNKMQDGMIILACIRHISNLALQIEFPGLTFGLITITRISDPFTTTLTQKLKNRDSESCTALKNMFMVGQLIPAKVLSIENTDKGHEVQVSTNPADLYANRTHNSFKKGALIWAYVVSELEHGYEMSIGVKGCRVFLPFKNTDESQKFVVGGLVYCAIHRAENNSTATTLTVSAKLEHVDKIQLTDNFSLDDLLPGTKLEFTVDEILPHGIKGQFLENCLGYLDETQIFSKVNINKLSDGSTLTAYVLFVEPITKVTYLTLRGVQNLPGPQHEIGKIIGSAEVLSSVSKGLYLKLGKEATGFVTNKRLVKALPQNSNIDIIDAVRKKFPVGSHHPCRILDYNYMQQLHICTFEQKIIKEKIFSVKDLTIGQNVTVIVDKIIPNGLIVKVGHVQGLVPNIHLSNVKYSNTIKAKYSVGMSVNARVLNITPEDNVVFTLKQGLIEAENCLSNRKDAVPNSQHVGFVVQTKVAGALIAFFGNVKGWISSKVLNSGYFERYMDPREYFFLGQVVSAWIVGTKDGKLEVSLNYPGNIKRKKIVVGKQQYGSVTAVRSDCLEIHVGKYKVQGTVPVGHLGYNVSLCPTLLKTYTVGDEITNLMCIKNVDIPVLSIRECIAYEENQITASKLRDLTRGMLLRCSFEEKSDSGIYVSAPILDHPENIHIANENLANADPSSFEKHELILAKVLNARYSPKCVTLDLKFKNNPSKYIHNALNSLIHNIEDLDRIIQFGQKNNWKLTQYKIGERVECTVQEIDSEGNCWAILPNEARGFVPKHLCGPHLKTHAVVEGIVLDYSFIDDCVQICCKNDVKQKINRNQGIEIKKSIPSSSVMEILLFTKLYVLGVLKDNQCNRQLVYLPQLLNVSDIDQTKYKEGGKLKIVLQRTVADRIIGIPKKLIHYLEEAQESEQKVQSENVEKSKRKKKKKEKVVVESNNTEKNKSTSESHDNTDDDESVMEFDEDESMTKSGDDTEEDESGVASDENMEIEENKPTIAPQSSVTGVILSGINSFYATEDYHDSKDNESSSSDEDTEDKEQIKKKRKLTPKERAELAKQEEERISKIEKELADSTTAPQSAEQFDRLLLANPNSSELWLKYMAMHVASTELEKARAVAKRAIETINMTLVKEKLNIWLALLNLENMYGTKETFDNVFNDAVKFNDSLEVYLSVIKLLASSGKLNEMEEKIKKVRSKEKQNSKMWLEIGQVYYSLEKFREARNIKEAALKSILDKRRQFDLIVRFGIMEFQSGELEQAVANFETILETYPSKINIWVIYIDQLVKKNKIDNARKVLERAIGQKFAVKCMKTIFQKFISFEEQHGTTEAVEEIKRKAKEYVKNLSRK